MFFSFFTRNASKEPTPPKENAAQKEMIRNITEGAEGRFFSDFKLFHRDSLTTIDLLLFFPHRGLYTGEKISWRAEDLKNASVERASRRSKKEAATRLETTQAKIHQKLQDVLSFDSTVCERFFWMENLSEEEFDSLDSSFHELLPKSRLIFCDESEESLRNKLDSMAEYQDEPYSTVKTIGSLNAHTLLLPTPSAPFGTLLSDEQYRFLEKEPINGITPLLGEYGSGKSTALIRKAIVYLLNNPAHKVLIITPALLDGELLRNEIVSLMEYSVINLDLSRIAFYSPQNSPSPLQDLKIFHEASAVLCDDAHLMDEAFIQQLLELRGNRWFLFASPRPRDSSHEPVVFLNAYRIRFEPLVLKSDRQEWKSILLVELHKRLETASAHDIMIIIPEDEPVQPFKERLDEYLGINCRILTPGFSLQYENLDDLILMRAGTLNALCVAHLFLIVPEDIQDYHDALRHASESATIISYKNPHGEPDEQNH